MLLKMRSLELDERLICRISELGKSVGLALDLLFPMGLPSVTCPLGDKSWFHLDCKSPLCLLVMKTFRRNRSFLADRRR